MNREVQRTFVLLRQLGSGRESGYARAETRDGSVKLNLVVQGFGRNAAPYAFGLTQDLAQSIGAYSHGMKQKLAIIAALLHEPKLILMDEPFVGLDPLASHQLKTQMKAFCAQGGAIFFSTHVLEVAEKLCDRVAILRKGQLVREGAMEQVRGDDTLEEVFLELEDTGGAL